MVDDDNVDVALFVRAVARTGFNIGFQALSTGQQAMDYLEAEGNYQERSRHPLPDLIVLDLRMPNVNGFDFLAWRKASSFFSAIPVVVFSGSKDQEEINRVFELGATIHIVKPESFDGWEGVVRQIWQAGSKAIVSSKALNSGRDAAQ